MSRGRQTGRNWICRNNGLIMSATRFLTNKAQQDLRQQEDSAHQLYHRLLVPLLVEQMGAAGKFASLQDILRLSTSRKMCGSRLFRRSS